jgi:hypothetical protein
MRSSCLFVAVVAVAAAAVMLSSSATAVDALRACAHEHGVQGHCKPSKRAKSVDGDLQCPIGELCFSRVEVSMSDECGGGPHDEYKIGHCIHKSECDEQEPNRSMFYSLRNMCKDFALETCCLPRYAPDSGQYPEGVSFRQEYPNGGYATERWRALVEKYFDAANVRWAMKIIDCTSSGDPKFETATNGGLFGHAKRYWEERRDAVDMWPFTVLDAESSVAAAAYVYYMDGKEGANHWRCHDRAGPEHTPGYLYGRDAKTKQYKYPREWLPPCHAFTCPHNSQALPLPTSALDVCPGGGQCLATVERCCQVL